MNAFCFPCTLSGSVLKTAAASELSGPPSKLGATRRFRIAATVSTIFFAFLPTLRLPSLFQFQFSQNESKTNKNYNNCFPFSKYAEIFKAIAKGI
jgi:hypothetical protein